MTPPLPRRGFLARLATSSLGLASLSSLLASEAHAAPATSSGPFDDSWFDRVKAAKHKAVFDSPGVEDGQALYQAWIFRTGFRDALGHGDAEVLPVVVLRHMGTALALDDAIWAKYNLGSERKINDPATGKPAEKNPWSRRHADTPEDKRTTWLLGRSVDASVEGLVKSGGVVLACNLAMKGLSDTLAKKTGRPVDEVHAELRAGVVPGVIVQPSGVYATTRAQEAGCSFLKSS